MAHPMTDAALLSDDEIDDAIDDLRASRCRNDPTARLIARAQPITDELRAIYRAGAARVVGIPREVLEIVAAANNLIAVRGRHHSERAYVRLVAAIDAAREQPQTDEKR